MIKVIALDIYGTVLATDDPDNNLPPRRGIDKFFDKCSRKKIVVVGASDANPDIVKIDLKSSHVDPNKFKEFYHLNQLPYKDFSGIIQTYGIKPRELLVIGDSDKDIRGAMEIGCCFFRVPEYFSTRDDLDLSKIKF